MHSPAFSLVSHDRQFELGFLSGRSRCSAVTYVCSYPTSAVYKCNISISSLRLLNQVSIAIETINMPKYGPYFVEEIVFVITTNSIYSSHLHFLRS